MFPVRHAWLPAIASAACFSFLMLALPGLSEARKAPRESECRPQKALDFLKRPSFVKKGRLDGKAADRALQYRVEHYGRVDGVGFAELNSTPARSQATTVRFFGLPVSVHLAIRPALECVEKRIRNTCTSRKEVYEPKALGGFRDINKYRGGEVSNHLFGIAVDIDPDRNPCCGCVDPWPQHRACRTGNGDAFKETELPACWINAFERYGFYWLGRDPQLRDTMHFEFLGNPERFVRGATRDRVAHSKRRP
ncbi:MAG TPA: M15 family metallopeptidase [Polyangiaceae bacterium]|nr:M15 family metallopeptidase [Polyangiaceae bacterium]